MDCREAQKLIPLYIRRELEEDKADELLDHVMNCHNCYEELELYYTIDAGLRELDGEEENMHSFSEAITLAMDHSRRELKTREIRENVYYVTNTILFWAVLVAVFVETRLILQYLISIGFLTW